MSRHSTAFKQSVVDFYGGGDHSYEEVVRRFGIDYATARKWVGLHASHGLAGLSRKISHYDAAFKLSVLQRMWKDELSHRRTAAIFNIRNASCLSEWERQYAHGGSRPSPLVGKEGRD